MNNDVKLMNTETLCGYESGYHNVSIAITGLYQWGIGYYSWKQEYAFHKYVYDALKAAGYTIEPIDGFGMCDRLHKDESKLDLYMHPMKFSGTASLEEANEIAEILDSCECIEKAWLDSAHILYDIPDMEYRDMFLDKAGELASKMLTPINFNYFLDKVAIDRVQAPSCGVIGSNQIDYNVLDQILDRINILRNEGIADADIPQKVQKWAEEVKCKFVNHHGQCSRRNSIGESQSRGRIGRLFVRLKRTSKSYEKQTLRKKSVNSRTVIKTLLLERLKNVVPIFYSIQWIQ